MFLAFAESYTLVIPPRDGEDLLSVVGLSSVISSSKESIICRETAVWLELTSTDKQPVYNHFPQTEVLRSKSYMFIAWHTRAAIEGKILFSFLLFCHLLFCHLPSILFVLMAVVQFLRVTSQWITKQKLGGKYYFNGAKLQHTAMNIW